MSNNIVTSTDTSMLEDICGTMDHEQQNSQNLPSETLVVQDGEQNNAIYAPFVDSCPLPLFFACMY